MIHKNPIRKSVYLAFNCVMLGSLKVLTLNIHFYYFELSQSLWSQAETWSSLKLLNHILPRENI